MRLIAFFLLLCSIPAFASKKGKGPYIDGKVVSMRIVSEGMHCYSSGNTNASATSDTTATATSNTSRNCALRKRSLYTLSVAGQTLVVTPAVSAAAVGSAMLTLGISNVFRKDSCLYGALPGMPIQIRSDAGTYYIKCGKRESTYKLVSAE